MDKYLYEGGHVKSLEFPDLEAHLQATLRPVKPSKEFVQDLGRRVLSRPDSSLAYTDSAILQYSLLVVAGLVTGSILLVLIIRGILTQITSLGKK